MALKPELCRPEAARAREATGPYLGVPPTGFGAIRAHGVEFAVPMWVEEVAPGGVAAPDPRGANAAHGLRMVEQLVAAGASICAQLRDHAPRSAFASMAPAPSARIWPRGWLRRAPR
jgi:creatinine amidohydrolase